jgi:hypothetical protein
MNMDPGTNVSSLSARAELQGWFFNDGRGGADDRTGNVIANLQMARGGNGINRITGTLSICDNAACTVSTSPLPNASFSTIWSLDTPLILEIAWDEANGKFVFAVTNPATSATESKEIVYQGTVVDAGPPTVGGFDAIQVRNSVKNCSTGRKRVMTEALFDNVQVRRQP